MKTKQTSEMLSFKDTYFDKLPEELIDYIWQFNHHNAAIIINYYARKYICNSVLHIKEMVTFALHSKIGVAMENHKFFYKNKIMDKNDVFSRFKACQCCKRHQILKPKVLQSWIDTDFHGTQYTPCKCICRHYTRFLCRGERKNIHYNDEE
jgi:hypothetical protein